MAGAGVGSAKRRVAVIGAGPAGLAAAARVLENGGGNVSVTILHMGHHFGGKAATYQDARGEHIEHGWHMVLGFYTRMKALMARAGVSFEKSFSTMHHQSHCYERWSDKLHRLNGSGGGLSVATRFMGYEGLPPQDRANFNRFMASAYATALRGTGLERHDDICWDAYAYEEGLRPHITKYSFFRMFRELYFNFPEHISAYHMLKTLRFMNTSEASEIFVCRGRFSEVVWDPIADYVKKLGAKIEGYAMVTGFTYAGARITGLRIAKPDGAGHHDGATAWMTNEIPKDGGEHVYEDFDDVICTVPAAVFSKLNKDDAAWWSSTYFARIRNLRSASTVGMRIITKEPLVGIPEGPIFGIPAPLGNAFHMTPHLTLIPGLAAGGDIIDFVGQENGFESWTDDQIVDFTLDNLGKLFKVQLTRKNLSWYEFHRNRADHERIFLCEPGVQKFRPGPRTPFANLFLAGDWVKNAIDLVCMEGAIVAGEAAADLVLEGARR